MKQKKKLAAKILKTSPQKIKFSADALEDIKKAITRSDFRGLMAVKKITKATPNQHSRSRARRLLAQKRKGRRKGRGSRKGSKYSSVNKKQRWMARIRVQREFLKELKDKGIITPGNYRQLYAKSSGGFFRNRRHIKLYISEHHLTEGKKDAT